MHAVDPVSATESGKRILQHACWNICKAFDPHITHFMYSLNVVFFKSYLPTLAGKPQLSDTVHHIAKLYAKGAARHPMAGCC